MSVNVVVISGNLTRDPEIRATAGGTSILNFGMAVSDRRKNAQTGEWEDVANFVDCVLFGKRADSLSRIMTKGMKVTVYGKLRYSSWVDKDTQRNRSKLEVVAEEVDLMQRREQQAGQQGAQNAPYGQQQQQPNNYTQQPQNQPQNAPQQPYGQQQQQYPTTYQTSYDNYGNGYGAGVY